MEKFIHVNSCDSTQDLLKEQLTRACLDDFTVSCETQTRGRGRGENTWEDSPGTLCFSMTVDPHHKPSFTALEISLIVCRFFQAKEKKIYLKWPNDLLNSDGKKCGGILIQNSANRYIAGIGLNLFFESEQFGGVYETEFSLKKKDWCHEISGYIRSHRYLETEHLSNDWLSLCAHLNQNVCITEGDESFTGIFKGLGPYGEALVETNQGAQHIFNGSLRLI